MKKYLKAKSALLTAALCLLTLTAQAQQNKHNLKANLGVGYGSVFHGIQNTKTPGGVEFGAGIGYEFNRDRLMVSIGAEFMYLNSKTNLNNYTEHKDYLYQSTREDGQPIPNPEDHTTTMEYHYSFLSYIEKHKVGYLNIPIQIGMTFADRYYAMIGAKIGLNMMASYDLKSTLRTTATDPTLAADLQNIPNHFLTTTEFNDNGKLSLGLNLAPTVEFGVILDKWINKRYTQLNNKSKTPVSYRAGIVADYSVLNINTFNTNRGLFTEPGKHPLDINMNGLLSSTLAKDKRAGNFYIGAKFTVLFQMNKQKPKQKRTPPPPRQPRPQPPTFYGKIIDAETNEDMMQAELIITKKPENTQAFKGKPNARTKMINRRLQAGTYELNVQLEGYLNYHNTIELTKTDTITIELEKIKKEEPIIIHDLFFQLNSAIIDPESKPALDQLAELMNKNPQINIDIVGHTDNTGQPAYNQTLSENRAKAVYQELINRGIQQNRIKYSGKGATKPIDTNDTEQGRANNRRVEFTIY